MARLPVMEIFGPTIQGEGMAIGRKTMFVRTGGCDYHCSWCDSKFTWDGSQKAVQMTPDEVWTTLREVGGNRFDYVTISGGNPALLKQPMADLTALLHAHGVRIGLETQGSVWQDWFRDIDDLTLSPKPPSSGMDTNWSVLENIILRLGEAGVNASLKVVVFDQEDYSYAKRIHATWPHLPMFLSVGNDDVVAEGDVSRQLLVQLESLVDTVIQDDEMNDVRILPQLHVLLWGNKRGV